MKTDTFKKTIKIIISTTIFILFVTNIQYFKPTRYSVSGAGEGSIILDKITGRTWVLELNPMPHIIDREFIGPKKTDYIWVPASVKPAYSSLPANTPKEAVEIEKLKIKTNSTKNL